MKKTELYQISPDPSPLMNCYVFKTKNEKLVVIDGGFKRTRSENEGYLYKELQRISGKEVPEIEFWFLSHLHDDHITEFCRIAQNNLDIKINNVYFNFPKEEYFEWAENGNFLFLYKDIEKAYDKFFGEGSFRKCEGKTAFEGDIFETDGLKIEILMTYSEKHLNFGINDTSMIFRVTVDGQRVLFLGDSYISQGNRFLEKYGEDARSDIVQMSHHGQNGVTEEVYKAISPKLCLWPSADWIFDNWNGNLNTFETREWLINMGVKYHLIVGRYGTQMISLPTDFSELKPEDISVPKK